MKRISITVNKATSEYLAKDYEVFAGLMTITLDTGRKVSMPIDNASELVVVDVPEVEHE